MLHGITHCLLRDSIKLSCYWRANRYRLGVRCNHAFYIATVTGIHGQAFQRRFQVVHCVTAFGAPRGESYLPGRFVGQLYYCGSLVGFVSLHWPQLCLKQFCPYSDRHELLPYSVLQVICDAPLFAGTTLDHLTFDERALRDFSLHKRGPLLRDSLKFGALLAGPDLGLFSVRNIEANCRKPLGFSAVIKVHVPMRVNPSHAAVWGNNTKLYIAIFAVLDRLIHCLSNSVAILCVPARHQVLECDPSKSRQTQLSTALGRDADFISLQIPLPQFEISGFRSEVESLLSSFPCACQACSEGRERQKRSGIHQPDDGNPIHRNVAELPANTIYFGFL